MRTLLAAAVVSLTGDGAFAAAAPLLAATISPNPIAVATTTAAAFLPWLVVGLPAGALVDRWDRRVVMVSADLIRSVLLAVLVALVVTTTVTVPVLVVIVFTIGAAGCFFDAASQATIPMLVGRDQEDLTRANARLWSADTFGRQLAGPLVGASSFTVPSAPFIGDLVSFLVSAGLISRLPRQPRPVQPVTRSGTLEAIRCGLSHLVRTPPLRTALAWTITYNLAYNAAYAVLVLYSTRLLHLPGSGYGLLLAVMAVGALAGAQAAPALARRLPTTVIMSGTLALSAAAWTSLAIAPNVITAFVGVAVVGACTMFGTVVLGTIRQVHTPDGMLGRVVAAFRLFGIGASGIGAVLGGVVAEAFGLQAPFLIAPTLALIYVAVVGVLAQRSRQ